MTNLRRIRRSQTLAPFGVGAIYDIVGESFVAEDTSMWRGAAEWIRAPRIAAAFGVQNLRTAPAAPEGWSNTGPGVPFFRFPQWLFCPSCRKMVRWRYSSERLGAPATCGHCPTRRQLVPMRFVMICGNGHLDDVNWRRWAHSAPADRGQKQCGRDDLYFRVVKGVGGGLQSLRVECRNCGAGRNLKGIASPGAPRQIGMSCPGRQPWLGAGAEEPCDVDPVIVQRGASNVHFAVVESAIDIPPDSDFEHFGTTESRISNNPNFFALLSNPAHPMLEGMIGLISQEEGVTEDVVRRLLSEQAGIAVPAGSSEDSAEHLRREEWLAFTVSRERESDPRDNFVVERADLSIRQRPGATGRVADELARRFEHLVLAKRLREIRAFRGFYRNDMQRMVKPDLGQGIDWLSAVEVFGEGIFFSLREADLRSWESRPEVAARVEPLVQRRNASIRSKFLPTVTPRFVMLHTFAHLLIRQLIFESGYSSASLRERLYVAAGNGPLPMCGALIYTGAGDSEGTLGGLVRNGEPDWFLPVVIAALHAATWCSLDPVCRETPGQGPDSLSLAGCHACALTAETSCDHANGLLDRLLVVDPDLGFFGPAIADGSGVAPLC